MKQQATGWWLAVGLAGAALSAGAAAATNAPPAATNAPAKPTDYRAMLKRVRDKQQARDSLEELQAAVGEFQRRFGRLPAELAELAERAVLAKLPTPPEHTRFVYDRATGNIKLAPVTTAPTRPQLPDNYNLLPLKP